MQLSEHEEKLLLRGLDKASAPAEVETAADKLFRSLRTRGVSGYDVRDQLEAGSDYMPYEAEGTPEWEEAHRVWDDLCRRDAAKNQAQSTFRGEHSRTEGPSVGQPNPVPEKKRAPVKLLDSLMVWGSFLVAWLLTHHVIATLILGFILAGLWVGSRIFRRIVVWGSIAVAIIGLFALLYSLASSVSSRPGQHVNTAALPIIPVQNSSSPHASKPVVTPDPEVTKLVERIRAQPSMQEQIAKFKAEDRETDLDKSIQHATSFLDDWAPRAVLEQLPAPRAQRVSPSAAPRAIPLDPYTPVMRARIKVLKAAGVRGHDISIE